MEVAIRAANWLVAMEYFDSEVLSQEFLNVFYTSIYEHGKFIRSHLEYSPKLTMNHYLSDIAGLFFIAIYCPFFKESRKWQEFCLKELSQEIEKQVYDDGCNFEASTSYHRLVLEMFFYCGLLGQKAGIEFPKQYRDKLRKMFEFSLYCVKPNGKIPQIGDNDSGRFLIFSKREILEHKYLLNLAAIYYNDSLFKLPEFDFDEEAFWVFGAEGKSRYDNLPLRQEPLKSKAFSDTGWYIMRHNKDYCFISCGPNGQNGNGGHAHNDKLSFELMLDGEDVVIDPGTYVYTSYPDWRNKFRSTAYHNTIYFDGIEQNDISGSLFAMKQGVKCRVLKFEETEKELIFEGEVEYLNCEAKHKRKFILSKQAPALTIIDEVKCKDKKFTLNFCISNNFYKRGYEIKGADFKQFSGHYSGEYGKKEPIVFLKSDITLTQGDFINTITIRKKGEALNETSISEERVSSSR